MKTNLIKVTRYAYEDKTGVFHSGCIFSCMIPTLDTEDSFGYDVKDFRAKYEMFEKLKTLYQENKPVDLVVEYIPMRNGNYYLRAKAINGIEL